MIVAVCLNLLIQTAFVYVYNQPITEVGLIFTMLKPAADMVRVVSNYCLRCVVQSLEKFAFAPESIRYLCILCVI